MLDGHEVEDIKLYDLYLSRPQRQSFLFRKTCSDIFLGIKKINAYLS